MGHSGREIDRPNAAKLAFVLGSGGVRSAAAIGIAEVLSDEGIQPDLIVGCSSGALFGATLAMGLPRGQALRMATELWSVGLTEQRRWLSYAQLLAPRLAGFNAASFALRDDRLIRARLEQAFGGLRIEELRTRLRIVTADAETGRLVVLAKGPLVPALRASIAVPLVFPSVEVDQRRLVDGVIVEPLPLSAASDASATLGLGFEGAMPRRPSNAARLVAQTSTAMINNLLNARIDAARASGQRLHCFKLQFARRVGLWDPDALAYVHQAGRRAAQSDLPAVRALLRSGMHRATVGQAPLQPTATQ